MDEEQQNQNNEELQEQLKQDAEKAVDKAIDATDKTIKVAKKVEASTSLPCATGCGVGCAIIVIVLIIIGFIAFMFNMPDSVRAKVIQWWDDTWRGSKVFWSDSISEALAEERLESTAQYLENMGFDLPGYGFLDPLDEEEEENFSYRYFEAIFDKPYMVSYTDTYNGMVSIDEILSDIGGIKRSTDFYPEIKEIKYERRLV